MSDRTTRTRLVDLSIVAVSAAVLAGGWLAVARVERQKDRTELARPPTVERPTDQPADPEPAPRLRERDQSPPPPEPGRRPAPRPAARPAPPVRGVVPAPPPRRRIIIRRTRAS